VPRDSLRDAYAESRNRDRQQTHPAQSIAGSLRFSRVYCGNPSLRQYAAVRLRFRTARLGFGETAVNGSKLTTMGKWPTS